MTFSPETQLPVAPKPEKAPSSRKPDSIRARATLRTSPERSALKEEANTELARLRRGIKEIEHPVSLGDVKDDLKKFFDKREPVTKEQLTQLRGSIQSLLTEYQVRIEKVPTLRTVKSKEKSSAVKEFESERTALETILSELMVSDNPEQAKKDASGSYGEYLNYGKQTENEKIKKLIIKYQEQEKQLFDAEDAKREEIERTIGEGQVGNSAEEIRNNLSGWQKTKAWLTALTGKKPVLILIKELDDIQRERINLQSRIDQLESDYKTNLEEPPAERRAKARETLRQARKEAYEEFRTPSIEINEGELTPEEFHAVYGTEIGQKEKEPESPKAESVTISAKPNAKLDALAKSMEEEANSLRDVIINKSALIRKHKDNPRIELALAQLEQELMDFEEDNKLTPPEDFRSNKEFKEQLREKSMRKAELVMKRREEIENIAQGLEKGPSTKTESIISKTKEDTDDTSDTIREGEPDFSEYAEPEAPQTIREKTLFPAGLSTEDTVALSKEFDEWEEAEKTQKSDTIKSVEEAKAVPEKVRPFSKRWKHEKKVHDTELQRIQRIEKEVNASLAELKGDKKSSKDKKAIAEYRKALLNLEADRLIEEERWQKLSARILDEENFSERLSSSQDSKSTEPDFEKLSQVLDTGIAANAVAQETVESSPIKKEISGLFDNLALSRISLAKLESGKNPTARKRQIEKLDTEMQHMVRDIRQKINELAEERVKVGPEQKKIAESRVTKAISASKKQKFLALQEALKKNDPTITSRVEELKNFTEETIRLSLVSDEKSIATHEVFDAQIADSGDEEKAHLYELLDIELKRLKLESFQTNQERSKAFQAMLDEVAAQAEEAQEKAKPKKISLRAVSQEKAQEKMTAKPEIRKDWEKEALEHLDNRISELSKSDTSYKALSDRINGKDPQIASKIHELVSTRIENSKKRLELDELYQTTQEDYAFRIRKAADPEDKAELKEKLESELNRIDAEISSSKFASDRAFDKGLSELAQESFDMAKNAKAKRNISWANEVLGTSAKTEWDRVAPLIQTEEQKAYIKSQIDGIKSEKAKEIADLVYTDAKFKVSPEAAAYVFLKALSESDDKTEAKDAAKALKAIDGILTNKDTAEKSTKTGRQNLKKRLIGDSKSISLAFELDQLWDSIEDKNESAIEDHVAKLVNIIKKPKFDEETRRRVEKYLKSIEKTAGYKDVAANE